MKFVEYKNHLEMNGINLFDCYYRVSYFGLMKLNNITFNQTGGSNNSTSPFLILKRLDKITMSRLVDSIISNNLKTAKYICNTY